MNPTPTPPTAMELATLALGLIQKDDAAFRAWEDHCEDAVNRANVLFRHAAESLLPPAATAEPAVTGERSIEDFERQMAKFNKSFPDGAKEPNETFLKVLMPRTKRPETRETYWEIYYNSGWEEKEWKDEYSFPMDAHKFNEMLEDFENVFSEQGPDWLARKAKLDGRRGAIKKKLAYRKKSA